MKETNCYESPLVEIIPLKLEKGFATSEYGNAGESGWEEL